MYGREAVFPSEVPVDMPLSTIILPDEKSYGMFFDEKNKVVETIKTTTAENISKSQEKQKQAYAKRIQKKYQNTDYHVGDEVLLFNMRKQGRKGGRTEPDFTGPYVIQAICGKLVTLSISKGATLKNKYNVNHIKPYRRSQTDVPSQESHKVPEECKTSKPPSSPEPLTERPQRPSVIHFSARKDVKILHETRGLECSGLPKIMARWKQLLDHTNCMIHLSEHCMGMNGWLMRLLMHTCSFSLKNSRQVGIIFM
ncbi:uncharacterized protein LOC125717765 [Brienomyrus brachyistius]|uniref:uncharacterized protein LOC125717765 n=1 Tax=Brienomyrus brachyistius TaxID=42636 RepID=UPI0020B3A3FD|nr:uncharacterized protein LOC125717765 [Brienomyrus brachyistius]